MNQKLHIDVLTPYGKYLSVDADMLTITSSVGVLGITPNHSPLLTDVVICKMTITVNGKRINYAVAGGILNIKESGKLTLLANAIERSDEIDVDRAREAQKRAEERLANKEIEIDVNRAKVALLRALNRISVNEDK